MSDDKKIPRKWNVAVRARLNAALRGREGTFSRTAVAVAIARRKGKVASEAPKTQVTRWFTTGLPSAEGLHDFALLTGESVDYWLGLSDKRYRDDIITLADGAQLTDTQLNEALGIRLNAALKVRMRQNDKDATFLRRFLARKRAVEKELPRRFASPPSLALAIAMLVEDTLRTAHKSYDLAVSARIEQSLQQQLGPNAGRIAKLAFSLAEVDHEYAREDAMDGYTGPWTVEGTHKRAKAHRMAAKRRRQALWKQYKNPQTDGGR